MRFCHMCAGRAMRSFNAAATRPAGESHSSAECRGPEKADRIGQRLGAWYRRKRESSLTHILRRRDAGRSRDDKQKTERRSRAHDPKLGAHIAKPARQDGFRRRPPRGRRGGGGGRGGTGRRLRRHRRRGERPSAVAAGSGEEFSSASVATTAALREGAGTGPAGVGLLEAPRASPSPATLEHDSRHPAPARGRTGPLPVT